MTISEIQDFIHVYSMFSFSNGSREPGILVNKYNLTKACVEYYFVRHANMSAYRNALETYDKESCIRLSQFVEISSILSIRPVSLADYKMMMQLLDDRNDQLRAQK